MNVEVLNELVEKNEWAQLPSQVITREGVAVDTTTDTWNLHYPIVADASIVFSKITNDMLRWCTKKYVYERLQFTSTHAGLMAFHDVWREFLRVQDEYQLSNQVRGEVLKEALIRLVEDSISHARSDHRLWALYRPVQWYLWCAENYSELGFCPAFALELDGMVVPGNPKGEAVRAEDKDQGPLHSTLELPLLIKALREDKGHKLAHLQQKAAVALSIALGRNPANLTYLKISDVVNLTPDGQDPCYVIKMPRIKKRHLNPRDSLLEEYLDPEFARYVCELVEVNKSIPTLVNDQGRVIEIEKPLFIKVRMNNGAVASGSIYDAFNMTSEGISQLIQSFVRRHNIVSPLTG
ncbi:MAG: site-specific integrase, partial [Bdellovibrionia bacterium]